MCEVRGVQPAALRTSIFPGMPPAHLGVVWSTCWVWLAYAASVPPAGTGKSVPSAHGCQSVAPLLQVLGPGYLQEIHFVMPASRSGATILSSTRVQLTAGRSSAPGSLLSQLRLRLIWPCWRPMKRGCLPHMMTSGKPAVSLSSLVALAHVCAARGCAVQVNFSRRAVLLQNCTLPASSKHSGLLQGPQGHQRQLRVDGTAILGPRGGRLCRPHAHCHGHHGALDALDLWGPPERQSGCARADHLPVSSFATGVQQQVSCCAASALQYMPCTIATGWQVFN